MESWPFGRLKPSWRRMMWSTRGLLTHLGVEHFGAGFSPDSDSYRGSYFQLQWHPTVAPSNATTSTAPSNGTTSTPSKFVVTRLAHYNGTLQWRHTPPPTIAHYNRTLQWHPAMARRPLPRSWSSPSPPPTIAHYDTPPKLVVTPPLNHSTLQWHPTMAPSNGTTSTAPCNGTLVPRPIGSSPSPPAMLFGWVDVVPLQGAIVMCSDAGREGWRPTLAEWTWCHCWVPILFHIFLLYSGPPISPRHPRKQQWILSWASCKRYTVLYIDITKIGFCYLGSMLV